MMKINVITAAINDWNNLTHMSDSLNFIKGLNAHIHSLLNN